MTPAELAKVTKAMRDLGFSAKEIDACGGAQGALLALMAGERSEVVRSGAGVAYGARRRNDRGLRDVEVAVAAKAMRAAPSKAVP